MKNCFYVLMISIFMVLSNNHAISDEPAASKIPDIIIQNLNMELPPNNKTFSEVLLPGEIAETEIHHIIIAGPSYKEESISKEYDTILIFIKGKGSIKAGKHAFGIESESIAFSTLNNRIKIQAAEKDTLHYIKIQKKLSKKDLEDIKSFPRGNRNGIYFSRFDECKAYTEKIKSPNTVSRTVLPKDYIPRVAMGTVEANGPDKVGAHEHPMLDQLFLGLAGNNVTVHADGNSIHFPEFSLIHIPLGSSHWVSVDEGKRMYYQWMDFFLTKEGEIWLKTHKPVDSKNK